MRTSLFSNSKIFHSCCPALLVFLAAGFLISCGSPTKNIELAKDSVGMFHARLDTEQYGAIYSATDDRFKAASTEADFDKLLKAVHNKLGTVQTTSLRNTGFAWYAGRGATVTLVYETKFSEGSGTEQFLWHIKDNQATLYGYHINSNDLVTQ